MVNGNSFGSTSTTYGHASKVWRSLRHVFPGGGTISNLSDFTSAGKIPAGSAVKFDNSAKTIKVYKDADITGASDLTTLGINGFLQEDVFVDSNTSVATGTVVYAGEIYEYALTTAVVTKLKTLTSVPQIVWVL